MLAGMCLKWSQLEVALVKTEIVLRCRCVFERLGRSSQRGVLYF